MTSELPGAHGAAIVPRGRSPTAVVLAAEGRALTDMQAAFVVAFTTAPGAIGNATASAKRAGYAETSARDLGRRLVALPHVQDAIRAANQQQISGALATKSIALLARVLEDEGVSMKVRVDAARTILDRAGYAASPSGAKNLSDKAMAEMTADELREVMRQARDEMDKAKIIDQPPTLVWPVLGEAVTVDSRTDASERIAK